VKWWAFNGSMSTAALLLPLMVAADSHIQTKAAGAAATVTSHLDFKIIIPTVLYLHVGSANDRTTRGAETVAIMSNSRNVTLNGTVRSPEPEIHSRGSVILSASARKVIAQEALCMVSDAHPAAPVVARGRAKVDDRQVVCTVSMP
jgi:hypothetical protein